MAKRKAINSRAMRPDRITRGPPKFPHETRVAHRGKWKTHQAELWAVVASIAGYAGYWKHSPFWAFTVVAFDTPEKAAELGRWLRKVDFEGDQHDRRREPCRSRAQYKRAAAAQYAVIWGLSTGTILDVVSTYRLYRRDCSSHGMPNWEAAEVIIRRTPTIDREKARQMVDYMLEWTIRHHGAWFWEGLQGDRTLRFG